MYIRGQSVHPVRTLVTLDDVLSRFLFFALCVLPSRTSCIMRAAAGRSSVERAVCAGDFRRWRGSNKVRERRNFNERAVHAAARRVIGAAVMLGIGWEMDCLGL